VNLEETKIPEKRKPDAEFTGQPYKTGRTVDSSTPTQSAAPASDSPSIEDERRAVNKKMLRADPMQLERRK
jgi:hypothetical protein